jgi:hypothetical protein
MLELLMDPGADSAYRLSRPFLLSSLRRVALLGDQTGLECLSGKGVARNLLAILY